MHLTTNDLMRYVGGDMEIQNSTEEYLYRGPIETATVEDGTLKVRFRWLAKNDGKPNALKVTWTKDSKLDYETSMLFCNVSNIGEGRLCLQTPITGELVVLFPPDGSKLDPAKVKGLTVV